MPIKSENKAKYAQNWPEIREQILERAGHCCERCGVAEYSVGWRDKAGRFVPNRGSATLDASGRGKWLHGEKLTYAEAREYADHYNCCGKGRRQTDDEGRRWFVVVLTIAHLNHDPTDNRPENILAMCSRCHLRHDVGLHRRNAAATRRKRREAGQPVLILVGEETMALEQLQQEDARRPLLADPYFLTLAGGGEE